MAISLLLEAVEQAQIIEGERQTTIVRRGWAKGLTSLALASNQIFGAIGPALTAAGLTYNSAYPVAAYSGCLLKERYIYGISGNSRKASFALIYRSPGGLAVPPVTFVLSRRTVSRKVETELDPATLKPIVSVWRDPNNSGRVISRTTPVVIDKTYQRLVADGYYVGQPPAAMLAAFNTVNDAPWRGLPKGYWHYCEQSDVTRDYGGSYNVTVELETKGDEHWAVYTTLRNPNGVYVRPLDSTLATLRDATYTYGMGVFNGITRVGPYKLAPFGDIFGFGNIGA